MAITTTSKPEGELAIQENALPEETYSVQEIVRAVRATQRNVSGAIVSTAGIGGIVAVGNLLPNSIELSLVRVFGICLCVWLAYRFQNAFDEELDYIVRASAFLGDRNRDGNNERVAEGSE